MYVIYIYKEYLFWIFVENVDNNVKYICFFIRIIFLKILKLYLILDYFKLRKIVLVMF